MTETKPGRNWIWWIVALIGVSVWGLYLYFFGPRMESGAPILEGSALSRPASYDWVLSDLDGHPVSFEKYRGKTVFLNIWATWCPPCVAELPSIARLARSPRLGPVAFVCVSIDQDAEAVRQFVKGKDWPLTILHASDLPPPFRTDGIPATFLIAGDGRIVGSAMGWAEWDDPAVVEFLERLASTPVERRVEGQGQVPAAPRPEPSAP